jgi:hypothetical protein
MTAIRKPAGGNAGGDATGELSLWLRWVLANAIGEAIGLGGSALLWAAAVLYLGEDSGPIASVVLAALAVLAGTLIEGTVVGTAQWLVLHGPLGSLRWKTWVLATGAGAFLAWTLGMVPSTLISLMADPSGKAAPPEPSDAVVYALAAIMGLVLGPILGFAQWIVLRRFVRRAALWMPANALAWAFGMVAIFFGVDLALGAGFGPATIPLLVITLACAGAVVGAVHGLALVWLLSHRQRPGQHPGQRAKTNPQSEMRRRG